MRIDDQLHARIIQKAKETVDKINNHYHLDMKVPPIYYDVTGTTAGLAKSASMSVHLNPTLLLQNLEDSINNTLPHEVCHLGVMQKAIKEKKAFPKAHGAEWKLMMYVVGVPAKNCHSYDVTDVKKPVAEYEYKCNCTKSIIVGQVIHNKIKDGRKYTCKKCNTILKNGERVMKFGFSQASPNGTTKVREDE
jgi:SprT protein